MKTRMLLSLMVSLIATSLSAADPMKPLIPDAGKKLRVACVGDSITQGSGAARGKSYPSQLQELLGDGWEVGNFGVSGRTLLRKGDKPYWKMPAYQKALKFKPDAVIIMLGTNDTKPQNWKHKAEFESDYRDLVKSFQELKPEPRIYICRPVPVTAGGKDIINEAGIQEQLPTVAKLAAELNIGTIDMYGALDGKPELQPDHVHPNTEGAGEMAKAAAKVLTGK